MFGERGVFVFILIEAGGVMELWGCEKNGRGGGGRKRIVWRRRK